MDDLSFGILCGVAAGLALWSFFAFINRPRQKFSPLRQRMDPATEISQPFSAHVRAWKNWYCLEGRHFDNGLRHPSDQLPDAPLNAQCQGRLHRL